MKRWKSIILALAILSAFLIGCAEGAKTTKIKCPKCGAFFSTREGAEEFDRLRGFR